MRLSQRVLLTILSALVSAPALAGGNSDRNEIIALVHQLSWDSVQYEASGFHETVAVPRGAVTERLIEIGKPATPYLIGVVPESGRGVAAHMVLCAIWRKDGVLASTAPIYSKEDPQGAPVALQHEFAGVIWRVDGDVSRADPTSLQEAKRRWCETVPKRHRRIACGQDLRPPR